MCSRFLENERLDQMIFQGLSQPFYDSVTGQNDFTWNYIIHMLDGLLNISKSNNQYNLGFIAERMNLLD